MQTFFRNLRPAKQRGLSLVELMVAIALGLVLSLAVMQIFLSSRGVFRLQDSASRLQESGRLALDVLSADIRMAGFIGCRRIDDLNEIEDHAGTGFASDTMIEAETASASTQVGGIDVVAGTDIVTIRGGAADGHRLAQAVNDSGSGTEGGGAEAPEGESSGDGGGAAEEGGAIALTLQGELNIDNDTLLIVSDCRSADVFSASAGGGAAGAEGGEGGGTDGTTTLTTSDPIGTYRTDAEVLIYEQIRYFVGETNRGTTSLYRMGGNGQPEEYVEDVESLRFEWGIGEGEAAVYRSTAQLDSADQQGLVSARINLLMLGAGENVVGTGQQAQEISFMGEAVPSDGRLRQVFSTTVGIRNRLP